MPKKKINKPSSRIIVRGVEYVRLPRKKGCEDCVGLSNNDLCSALPKCMPNIVKAFKFRVKPGQSKDEVRASLRGTSLTQQQIKDYMKDPSRCPRCCSESIEGESVDIENHEASQTVSCADCGLLWTDYYVHKRFTYQDDVEGDLE